MRWTAIARTDLRVAGDGRESRVLFAAFLLGFAGLAGLLVQLGDPEFDAYLDVLAPGVALLVPLAGIVAGYETVVGERETGTAVLALSMPHSRASLVAGKLAGRTTLLVAILGGAALCSGVAMALTYPSFSVVRYVGFVLLTALYGVVFSWLAAGLSMALSSSRRVIAGAFGAYIGLVVSWTVVVDLVEAVLFRFRPPGSADPVTWATAATFLGPRTSFAYLLAEVVDAGTTPPVAVDADVWFVTPAVAVAALIAWAVVPVVVGYRLFERDDL